MESIQTLLVAHSMLVLPPWAKDNRTRVTWVISSRTLDLKKLLLIYNFNKIKLRVPLETQISKWILRLNRVLIIVVNQPIHLLKIWILITFCSQNSIKIKSKWLAQQVRQFNLNLHSRFSLFRPLKISIFKLLLLIKLWIKSKLMSKQLKIHPYNNWIIHLPKNWLMYSKLFKSKFKTIFNNKFPNKRFRILVRLQ